jgi:hypothetical protein
MLTTLLAAPNDWNQPLRPHRTRKAQNAVVDPSRRLTIADTNRPVAMNLRTFTRSARIPLASLPNA